MTARQTPPFVETDSTLAHGARILRRPTWRDAGIYAWILGPVAASYAGRLDSSVYGWLVPLFFLLLAVLIQRLTRNGFRGRGVATAPHYFPSPLWIAAACALGVMSSWRIVRGDFDACGVWCANLVIGFGVAAGMPLLLVARCQALNWTSAQHELGSRGAFVLRSLMLLSVFGIAHLPRTCAHRREVWASVDEAMATSQSFVPRLEQWRNSHGVYPKSLSDLGNDAVLPTLVHGEMTYTGKGDWFSFDVPDPTEWVFPSGWNLTSENPRWHRYH